ncbi:MAG: CpaF family protein [Acidimicrobiia bacterium]
MSPSLADAAHAALIAEAAGGAAVGREMATRAVRDSEPLIGDGALAATVDDVVAAASGMGPLEALLLDAAVTDVMVNGDGRVWFEREGALTDSGIRLRHAQTMRLIERVVAPLGLRIDRLAASVDARLPDGSRVHAVVPPLAVDGPCLTIRRFSLRRVEVEGFTTAGAAGLLRAAVASGANLLVSGGTGSGKTTLLNALASAIPRTERVVTIEDTAELRFDHPNVVRLETRPASSEGVGECTARRLVKEALRMRPDRIVVGECRGGEALDMLMAMNTGHAGSMSTCHANDPEGALRRLSTLCLFADSGLPLEAARSEVLGALDAVIHVRRDRGGARRIDRVDAVDGSSVRPVVVGGEVIDVGWGERWT